MGIDALILIVVRALGGTGRVWLEKGLCRIDKVVRDSPTELDNEAWFRILLKAVQDHDITEPSE